MTALLGSIGRLLGTWWRNAIYTLSLIFSWGRHAGHEGRYRDGRWVDWAGAFEVRPGRYEEPETEDDIARIVAESESLRPVGAGHSFNDALDTPGTLLSLDRYGDVKLRDHPERPGWKIATIGAGVRLRDLTTQLHEAGVALPVAGSTDAQAIGGLIATDVHGTGRDNGFLSEVIRSLKMVDAGGNVTTVQPGDDVYHAAIGGAGTCGVVIGAEIECEPQYQLATSVRVVQRDWAESNVDALLAENSHLSFYYFGGFRSQATGSGLARVRMNKWDRTVDPPSRFFPRTRKMIGELLDMSFSGYLFDVSRLFGIAHPFARMGLGLYAMAVNQNVIVHPSHVGFARKLYYRHDEIEYGLAFDRYQDCLDEIRELLLDRKYPTIIEIRFTPNKSRSLIGPGAGRRTAYLELASSMSRPTDPIFWEFEEIVVKHGGRPHLGKKTWVTRERLETLHPAETLARFDAARQAQDPDGKFLNRFTRRMLVGD